MGRVVPILEKAIGKTCLGTFRRCLDRERAGVIEYDDVPRELLRDQGETIRYAGPRLAVPRFRNDGRLPVLKEMFIQSQAFNHAVWISECQGATVKNRIGGMDDGVMVRANDEDVVGIVVEGFREIVDVMRVRKTGSVFLADRVPANLAMVRVELL
jgi:hypothetical protein